jgi:histidyl-tRNA synthetase
MKKIKVPKGTKDIFPPEIDRWHFLEAKIRDFYARFNYQEVRTPIFEHSELFLRGIGDGTEVVSKEMYTFEDKGKRSLTLRPENTASVVRAAIENNFFDNLFPLRFYYIGPMFRYDKPQKGRYRQFHQFGVEIFADQSAEVDAELIFSALRFLNEIGIVQVKLLINSVGCMNCRPDYLSLLYESAKDHESELCSDCRNKLESNTLRIFDCKQDQCKRVSKVLPSITDHLCGECENHFKDLKTGLDNLGVSYIIDPGLVRGLDYYTKTAFEIVSQTLGAQDAILGGGRYNNLISELGGPDLPGVGFAAGMERILLHMKEQSDLNISRVFIASMHREFLAYAQKTAKEFWLKGYTAFVDYSAGKIGKQFKRAEKLGAGFIIIIGEDEVKNRTLTVKNMLTREQTIINYRDIGKWQKENL